MVLDDLVAEAPVEDVDPLAHDVAPMVAVVAHMPSTNHGHNHTDPAASLCRFV